MGGIARWLFSGGWVDFRPDWIGVGLFLLCVVVCIVGWVWVWVSWAFCVLCDRSSGWGSMSDSVRFMLRGDLRWVGGH